MMIAIFVRVSKNRYSYVFRHEVNLSKGKHAYFRHKSVCEKRGERRAENVHLKSWTNDHQVLELMNSNLRAFRRLVFLQANNSGEDR